MPSYQLAGGAMGRRGWRVVLDVYRLSSPIGTDCRSKIARYGRAEPRSAWSFYGKSRAARVARRRTPKDDITDCPTRDCPTRDDPIRNRPTRIFSRKRTTLRQFAEKHGRVQ
ncbi:hypothetical protein THER5_1978 [Bifidobacterium thermacidophilum subsp. thermacidophilum]|uniref:Uncharacterized protein n=1 Tax=Bifidobacterium thermacidophilum subsp. thermacidophilum TaxID=79262 RepID=A0A087E2D8_9BIFI|nr:hypothetical protein THER5_1978 [Bifidobacterium thermacidophilum subsp. thermacidophilum]